MYGTAKKKQIEYMYNNNMFEYNADSRRWNVGISIIEYRRELQ